MITVDWRNKHFDVDITLRYKRYVIFNTPSDLSVIYFHLQIDCLK